MNDTPTASQQSLVLMEIGNLTPALIVADRCAKAAGVRIVGIENTMEVEQCIKLAGSVDDVHEAARAGVALARQMGARADLVVLSGPTDATRRAATLPPEFIASIGIHDSLVPREDSMANLNAIGLLETQGLVAALHATDEMLKASPVELVGKEKIGSAYVTIIVRGDVAAVKSAIATGRETVERLEGKLIMADVITRPHPELAALLPT